MFLITLVLQHSISVNLAMFRLKILLSFHQELDTTISSWKEEDIHDSLCPISTLKAMWISQSTILEIIFLSLLPSKFPLLETLPCLLNASSWSSDLPQRWCPRYQKGGIHFRLSEEPLTRVDRLQRIVELYQLFRPPLPESGSAGHFPLWHWSSLLEEIPVFSIHYVMENAKSPNTLQSIEYLYVFKSKMPNHDVSMAVLCVKLWTAWTIKNMCWKIKGFP